MNGYVSPRTLRGYRLRGVYFGYGQIPIEQREVTLPDLTPGEEAAREDEAEDREKGRRRAVATVRTGRHILPRTLTRFPRGIYA